MVGVWAHHLWLWLPIYSVVTGKLEAFFLSEATHSQNTDLNARSPVLSMMILNAEKNVVFLFPQCRVFDFSLSQESITGKTRKLFHCSFLQAGSLIKKKTKQKTQSKKKNNPLFSFLENKKRNKERRDKWVSMWLLAKCFQSPFKKFQFLTPRTFFTGIIFLDFCPNSCSSELALLCFVNNIFRSQDTSALYATDLWTIIHSVTKFQFHWGYSEGRVWLKL